MASDYTYDESGQLWPYFVFTLSFIVTLPLTYFFFTGGRDTAALFPRIRTDYKAEHADLVASLRAKDKRKQRRVGLTIAVVVGWTIIGSMLYLISITEIPPAQRMWNPYDILGISESATEQAIKSTYRKLSRTLHPDKAKPDVSKNETLEMLNDRYVEISKAYQALTDEEIRNNYIQYGHPDGKQSFSINIGLPKAIVSDGNGKYVILVYFVLFGVLLPYTVGSWWYGTQSRSKEGTLMESANRLFREYKEDMDEGAVVTALSAGKEFEASLRGDKADAGLSRVESRITATGGVWPLAGGLSSKDKEALDDLDTGVRRKALSLLWAYLGRVELDDKSLETAKFEIGPIAHSLTRSLTAISLAYGNAGPILSSFQASQLMIQAMPPKASPLLQLPHITPAIAKAIEGGSRSPMSIQKFMDRPDAQRRRMAVGKDLLSEQQYKTAVEVAQQLPYFRVAKAFFKVKGEKTIIPSSLVTLVVKGRFIPPGSERVPEVNELDLEDVDAAEDDLDAITGRKTKSGAKGPDGKPVGVSAADQTPIYPPLAFAPRFGRDHSPRWSVFLTDSKQGKMAVPPFTFTQFDRPIFEAAGDDGGRTKPTYNMQTLKPEFQAPGQAGHYTFVMHVVCDSYVGFDTKMEVTLVVEDDSKVAEMAADEISEEDDQKDPAEDEDDESGTEEEADDTSATNTDTEPED